MEIDKYIKVNALDSTFMQVWATGGKYSKLCYRQSVLDYINSSSSSASIKLFVFYVTPIADKHARSLAFNIIMSSQQKKLLMATLIICISVDKIKKLVITLQWYYRL